MKAIRLLAAISVSLWMAGGCLFGCSNNAMAAEVSHSAPKTVSHHSCHTVRSRSLALAAVPQEMAKECPLAVSATAVASKSSGYAPEPGRAPLAALPRMETGSEPAHLSFSFSYLPNRGPTYLRCCVFLI